MRMLLAAGLCLTLIACDGAVSTGLSGFGAGGSRGTDGESSSSGAAANANADAADQADEVVRLEQVGNGLERTPERRGDSGLRRVDPNPILRVIVPDEDEGDEDTPVLRRPGFLGALGFKKATPETPLVDDAAGAEVQVAEAASEASIDPASTILASDIVQTSDEVTQEPAPKVFNLFAKLRPNRESDAPDPAALVEQTMADLGDSLDTADPAPPPAQPRLALASDSVDPATVKPARSGFFSFLNPQKAKDVTGAEPVLDAPESVTLAALPASDADIATDAAPTTEPATTSDAPTKPRLFGGIFAPKAQAAKTKSTVGDGEVLPFGVVGINCEAKPARDGKQVDKFPRSGSARWKLYDVDATSIAPRTHYITGFSDGCARQFTASLVLFGSAALHETHRYHGARRKDGWTNADSAYEPIKAKVCGVAKRADCPSGKLPSLEARLAFVSIYQGFGASKGDRLELLLDNGKLITQERHD